MLYVYLVKDLGNIRGGRVERLSESIAGQLLMTGAAEMFDAKKHGDKPGAPRLVERKPSRMVVK